MLRSSADDKLSGSAAGNSAGEPHHNTVKPEEQRRSAQSGKARASDPKTERAKEEIPDEGIAGKEELLGQESGGTMSSTGQKGDE